MPLEVIYVTRHGVSLLIALPWIALPLGGSVP